MVSADVWFCCLLPNDAGAVVGTSASFAITINQPIERGTFDTLWLASPLFNIAGIDTVLLLFGLEHTFIYIPDEPPIPAIGIVDLILWLDIEYFMLMGGAACGDGCDTPTFTIP